MYPELDQITETAKAITTSRRSLYRQDLVEIAEQELTDLQTVMQEVDTSLGVQPPSQLQLNQIASLLSATRLHLQDQRNDQS